VWTPQQKWERRIPRTNKREQLQVPIMPSFVFAQDEHRHDLIALSRSPSLNYRVWDSELRRMVVKGHPMFSLFRMDGKHRTISDASLAPLRLFERRSAPKETTRTFHPGESVKFPDGGFSGMTGTVVDQKGKYVTVNIPGWMDIKVAVWELEVADVRQAA